jgi:hypothetical protein
MTFHVRYNGRPALPGGLFHLKIPGFSAAVPDSGDQSIPNAITLTTSSRRFIARKIRPWVVNGVALL